MESTSNDRQGEVIKVFEGQIFRKEFTPAKFWLMIIFLVLFVALIGYSMFAFEDFALLPILSVLFGIMFLYLFTNFRQEMKGGKEIVISEHGMTVRNPSLVKLGFQGKFLPKEDIASIEVLEFPTDPVIEKEKGWKDDRSPAVLLLHLKNGRSLSAGIRYRDEVLEIAKLTSGRWGIRLAEHRHRL